MNPTFCDNVIIEVIITDESSENIKTLFISGYRFYELGIFSEDDDKLFYIKEFLKKRISQYIEEGLEWVIISGQMGIELWTGEVVLDLKEMYPEVKLSVLIPFLEFHGNWNEKNQALFQKIMDGADYVNFTSQKKYTNPGQFVGNQQFIIDNTEGCLLIYDTEAESNSEVSSKPSYLYKQIQKYQTNTEYQLELVSFDDLQEFVMDYQDAHFDGW